MTPTDNDVEQLQLLSIFHYIVGGIAALFAMFPIIHLVIGLAMISGRFDNGDTPFDVRWMGWFFVMVAAAIIMCGLAIAVCLVLAGRYLKQHTNYRFCLVVAAIACVFMPFGTVLGILTIIVLQRATVKQLFADQAAPRPVAS
jgi:hypothetical protein